MKQRLRIFLSSPSDVASAREIAAHTIEKLAQDYARHFDAIEPYLWEHESMVSSGHFQDSIEPPSAFDIVVLILWSRLGTPLPERTALRAYQGIDGRAPVTGTEWEYEEALARARLEQSPDLLVFRSLQPAAMDMRDPDHRDEQLRQAQALDAFWGRHFANQGSFLGAFFEFAGDDDFAVSLENQLRKLIERRTALAAAGAVAEAEHHPARVWTQAPFRGLEAYAFEHAPIFFGQDDAVGRGMLQLEAGAQAGSPFLLVLGASGSGKSSLVKAGIVPKLFVPRRITGAAFLRRVHFRPSDMQPGEDIFDAFARRLTTKVGPMEGLPALLSPDVSLADLAAHLRGGGAEPTMPLRLALGALAAEARREGRMLAFESPRMVLVVDQLEELFTLERIPTADRARFVDLLDGLARSGLVWVVVTMRKDFWHRADETPVLVRMSEQGGRLELLPPTPAQFAQMIRRPAEAAGLRFESHPTSGIALNEVIAESVARDPGALPLLSYLLDQLYNVDVLEAGGAVLTFATYEKLGRLEGAIATKAEAVLSDCAEDDRAALGSVLFSLLQMGEADDDVARAVSRRVPLSAFPEGTAQRRLVDALRGSQARLLVSDAEEGAEASVRVAHEALISRWTRAREFVQANAEALKIRRRIEARHAQWRSTGGDAARAGRGLAALRATFAREPSLLTDLDLADGLRLLRDHSADIEPAIVAYIERSAADERQVRDRAFRALAAVAGVVAVLAVLACGAAVTATIQTHQALQARAWLLTEAAAQRLKDGDVSGAQAIILEVLSDRQMEPAWLAAATNVFQEARGVDMQFAVLSGHAGGVHFAVFSPDGRRIATAGRDGTARVWDAATGAALAVLSGHAAPVEAIAWSPDGRRAVTAAADRTAIIWDLASGQRLATLNGHGGTVWMAAFSPDGQRIATASEDHTARIWDAATGEAQATLAGHDGPVYSAAFSPDGRRIVTASADKSARVWDAANGARIAVLLGHADLVNSAAFSPDGTRIVTASSDRTVRVWDSSGGAAKVVIAGHSRGVYGAAFSPDGRRIVSASHDLTARVWDASSGAQLAVLAGHVDVLNWAAYAGDGGRIVTASDDGTARIWMLASTAQLAVLSGHAEPVETGAFSPDGRHVVTAADDRTAAIWDAFSGARNAVLGGHGDIVTSATYSPDGRSILTASDDHTARLWDAATGAPRAVLTGHSGTVFDAAFSPDGARVATASADRTTRLWDTASARPLAVLRGHGDEVGRIAFSRDGRRLATGSFDKTARVWDTRTGAQIAVMSGHTKQVVDAALSPDGRRLVTASEDGTARLWDANTGAPLAVLRGHRARVNMAVFSPDGRRILTAAHDHTARLWDGASGAPLVVLAGHGDIVETAVFSPDGRRIATASADRTIRLWDASNGGELAVLHGHEGFVEMAAFSADGRKLVSASDDKTARVWSALVPADLATQIAWSEAASLDTLPAAERSRLGLASGRRDQNPLERWFHASASRPDARLAALGRAAEREELRAIAQTSQSQRDALLLQAFSDYAMAAARAEAEGLDSAVWRHWRYRRASLARVLAREGMMQAVAEAFENAVRR